MDDLIIVGAGGFGREVASFAKKQFNIIGFVDDNLKENKSDICILGSTDYLLSCQKKISVCIAIANPIVKKNLYNKIKNNKNLSFPNIIADNVIIKDRSILGFGNIICENVVITCDSTIGNFVHINIGCSVGHDVVINDYVTIYPLVSISGNTIIGKFSQMGTNSTIIQGCTIGENTFIGAGATVIRNIGSNVVAVGTPCKVIKEVE